MEFKAQEKWRVQQNFSITEKQLDVAIKKMQKRHPLEKWVNEKLANNGEEVVYLKLEFIEWLKDVYYNRKVFYLDAEINFFEKQIVRLENELNLPHKEFDHQAMTVREACNHFEKCINTLYSGLTRMRKNNIDTITLEDGRILIPAEGVQWLSKNYFRSSYLEKIELYKLELQKQKRKAYAEKK